MKQFKQSLKLSPHPLLLEDHTSLHRTSFFSWSQIALLQKQKNKFINISPRKSEIKIENFNSKLHITTRYTGTEPKTTSILKCRQDFKEPNLNRLLEFAGICA